MLDQQHAVELDRIERADGGIVVQSNDYPSGYLVHTHVHKRTQLLSIFGGIVLVETARGRFMTPPGHALLIPPLLPHAVSMLSDVMMTSVYVSPAERSLIRERPTVVELTDLARSLLLAASALSGARREGRKFELIERLLIGEILELRERPLTLPLPRDNHLAALCRDFLADPSPYVRVDAWAERLGMSRRTFTRFFRREMNVSFAAWRQQASVVLALPRLAEGEAVTTVALEAGYESAAAFTTMFHRVLGVAPRDYIANGRSFADRTR